MRFRRAVPRATESTEPTPWTARLRFTLDEIKEILAIKSVLTASYCHTCDTLSTR